MTIQELNKIDFYSMTGAAEYCELHYNLFRMLTIDPPLEFPQPLRMKNARGRDSLFFTRDILDQYKMTDHWRAQRRRSS